MRRFVRTNFLSRWLLRRQKHAEEKRGSKAAADPATPVDKASLIQSFIGELEADGHDWARKIRLINFEAFRDRLGPTWPKIRPKIELLAEKLIRDQMSDGDRYLAVGESEFLVFYAGASAEEIRIRCFAIAEEIQQKLFGVTDQQSTEEGYRFAEVHAPNDDLALAWEQTSSAQQKTRGLRDLFRKEPERPDVANIAASAQTAIDSFIVYGLESGDFERATALQSRLNRLSDGAALLSRSLSAGDDGALASDTIARLDDVRNDAAELRRIFDSGKSQAEIVEALAKLRKARAEKAALRSPDPVSAQSRSRAPSPENFQYLPVLRSVSHGEQIYQGIFRITNQALDWEENNASSDIFVLEHALKFLANNKHPAHFPLMASVHAETLRSPLLYRKYSTLVRAAAHLAKRFIVLEIVAGGDAADSIAMRRAIEELKAHFLAIFVVFTYQRAGALENAASELKKAGAHALGVEFSQAPESSAPGVLKKITSACRQNTLSSYATDIRNFTIFAEAISAGIGYASAPVVRPALAAPVIERTSFGRLYYVASRIGHPRRQVLLAEDESMFRDAVAEYLKASGFEVFGAPDGEEALATLKKHPHIALLISDVRMPRMDGYSLVEASLELKPDLKVIMMTGYAIKPSKLLQHREIDTLRKPFDLNVLGSRAQNLATDHRTTMLD